MAQNTPLPPVAEHLPTDGSMGTEPALSVGAIMGAAGVIVYMLGSYGVTISPEIRAFFDQNGGAIALLIIGLVPVVQGWLTRGKVYAPASVQALLARK